MNIGSASLIYRLDGDTPKLRFVMTLVVDIKSFDLMPFGIIDQMIKCRLKQWTFHTPLANMKNSLLETSHAEELGSNSFPEIVIFAHQVIVTNSFGKEAKGLVLRWSSLVLKISPIKPTTPIWKAAYLWCYAKRYYAKWPLTVYYGSVAKWRYVKRLHANCTTLLR